MPDYGCFRRRCVAARQADAAGARSPGADGGAGRRRRRKRPPAADTERRTRSAAEAVPEPVEAEELVPLEEADAEESTGKVKAVVPESEDDIEIDETIEGDDDDDSTFIPDEEEGDEDVTDIIGDVGGDEET